MSECYHFLTAPIFPQNNLEYASHFDDIRSQGVLLPRTLKEQEQKTIMLDSDPEEDCEHVFLHPNIDWWKQAKSQVVIAANYRKQFVTKEKSAEQYEIAHRMEEYAFAFNIDAFRDDPKVSCRYVKDYNRRCIHSFVDQDISDIAEIMYKGALDLSCSTANIIKGVYHV